MASRSDKACLNYTIADCTGTRGIPNGTLLDTVSGWKHSSLFEMLANPPLFDAFNGDFWLGTVEWTITTGVRVGLSDGSIPIATYTGQHYWLGLFGLGNDPTIFDENTTVSGPLQAFNDEGHIGSMSYGYTAGAQYSE